MRSNFSIFLYWCLSLTSTFLTTFGNLTTTYGLVKITARNYETSIMGSGKEAWILAIESVGKISLEEWMEFEFKLRGLVVRVGIIDPRKDGAFLKRKGFLGNSNSYPVARVFPYGGEKIKLAGFKDTHSMAGAKKTALSSLPDETTKITKMIELEHFVHAAYGTSPPRFPVLLFTDKQRTAPLFRALALKYSTYFNFGVVRKPSEEFRQKFKLKEQTPSILVLLGKVLPSNKLDFGSAPYDRKSYGEISYLTVAKFIYSVHQTYWEQLPNIKKYSGKMTLKDDYEKEIKAIFTLTKNTGGDETTKSREKVEFKVEEITHKNYRDFCWDDTVGLCLIAFVNGEKKKLIKQSVQLMKDVQKMAVMKDKPVQYLWVDAACHPEYGEIFGIFPETLPTLLVTKPRQRLFTTRSLKGESPGAVSELIMKVFQSNNQLQKYARFNDMVSLECQKKHRELQDSKNDEL